MVSTFDVRIICDVQLKWSIFSPDRTMACTTSRDAIAAAARGCIYLCDATQGDEQPLAYVCARISIIASSPNEEHHKNYKVGKTVGATLWMYPWTKHEAREAMPYISQNLQPELASHIQTHFERRFNLFGGSPRFLFAKMDTVVQQAVEMAKAVI